jgi:Ni/Co efflux regulator RcnB
MPVGGSGQEKTMKYLMTAAMALSLMAGSQAFAQEHNDHDRGGGGGEHRGGPQAGGERRGGPGPQGGPPGGTRFPGRPEGGARPQGGPAGGDHRGADHRGPDRRDFGRPGVRRGPEPGFRPGGFLRDRGWRGGRFRGPSYAYPRGFGYQRWAFGSFLPFAFMAPDYTLGSYWTYGLPAPPPGYHWIRVGPDALLVRYGDGYVLDAAYGIFY